MTDLIPAIGYVRVSMWREDAISPELQREAIEGWAARTGRRIIDWVTDLDKTGRNFKRDIMKVIARIEAGEARECAVWRYSRFGRTRLGVQINLDRIEQAGGQLQSATEAVDARTATGRLQRGVLMEFNAYESDRAGEQWAEVHAYRKASGLPPIGRKRFGYERLGRVKDPERPHRTRRDMSDPAGERYVKDPVTGAVLREMYRACTAGDPAGTVARRLNESVIRNTRGLPWSGRTVRDVLDSGFGAGYLRVHDPECDCTGNASKCPRKILIRGAHKPVITEPEWQAYLAQRNANSARPPRARNAAWRLSGLIRCGHCGSACSVIAQHRRHRHARLRCSRWARTHDCPSAGRTTPYPVALDAVLAWLDTEGVASDEGATALAAAAASARGTAAQLAAELAAIDRRLAQHVARQLRDDEIPEDVWEEAKAPIVADRKRVVAALAAEEGRAKVAAADVVPAVRSLAEGWDVLPAPRIREILAGLIHYVVVWRADEDGVKIHRARVFPAWEPGWAGPGSDGIPG